MRARAEVKFTGIVQGVHFRDYTRRFANQQKVCGWVRNLPDGAVELEAEGPPAEVQAFLKAVTQHFCDNIRHEHRTTLPPRGDELRFEIRY